MSSEDSDFTFLQTALLAMLDASSDGLIVIDAAGCCRMIGRRVGELFGIEPAAYVGRPGVEALEACARACNDPDAFLRAAAEAPGAATGADVDVRPPNARTVSCRVVAMVDNDRPSGRVVFVRDVTVERAAESSTRHLRARLRALMPFDGLTGLLNQRRLYEELGREHSRSTRAWDSYALLRVDIDGMAAVNSEFGVPAGDQVIEQIARRLETCIREYDVLARVDADEFGVLLPGADGVAARAVAERMMRAVADDPFALQGPTAAAPSGGDGDGLLTFAEPLLPTERTITLSVGGALWVPPSRDSAEGIFRRAGDALREARRSGGGKLLLYTP